MQRISHCAGHQDHFRVHLVDGPVVDVVQCLNGYRAEAIKHGEIDGVHQLGQEGGGQWNAR